MLQEVDTKYDIISICNKDIKYIFGYQIAFSSSHRTKEENITKLSSIAIQLQG